LIVRQISERHSSDVFDQPLKHDETYTTVHRRGTGRALEIQREEGVHHSFAGRAGVFKVDISRQARLVTK
jgi:hypothetical protein